MEYTRGTQQLYQHYVHQRISQKHCFQSFLENYTYKKKKLFWYAASTGRESNHEIPVRKALSEDARLRGRFVKAAMEAINETHRNEVEFYPSWHENAVREKQSHNYLVWIPSSYATASCEIFVDEPSLRR